MSIAVVLALIGISLAGTLGVAAFIVLTAALFGLGPRIATRDLLRYAPLLLIPALAIVSTIWSDAPERTLRAALQLMLTFVAAILICRRIGAGTLILTLLAGYTLVCLLMIPDIPAALSRGVPLFSTLLGSKNQVAFASHTLIALSLAVAFDRGQPLVARLLTPVAFVLGFVILRLSQSGGGTVSLVMTLITFPAFMLFGRVNISLRIAILVAALIAVGVALVFLPDLTAAWNDFRVSVLKKDATLTGRTHLWDIAARLVAERPWLGRGYYAFWRQGNIDAEGLWRWGGIANRSGFNFHNSYIEMQVDLGWVGLGLLLATSSVIAVLAVGRQLLRPSIPMAFLLSYLIIVYLRGLSETILIAQFGLTSLLMIAVAIYSMDGLFAEDDKNSPSEATRGFHTKAALRMTRSAGRVPRRS